MNFKNGVKKIQAVAYNGERTVFQILFGQKIPKAAIVYSQKHLTFEFYKLHSTKGHGYTYNQWKRCDLSRRTIFRQLEKFDKEGPIERKPGSGKSPKLSAGDKKKLKSLVLSKYLVLCILFLVRKLNKGMIKQHYYI